ncbi:Uncharacterised protein [Mycobacteroides abscessus subsp. abscessus]|nr:Uncharacterised protein [Mycobacteroides abscessus subsp. abscessus]
MAPVSSTTRGSATGGAAVAAAASSSASKNFSRARSVARIRIWSGCTRSNSGVSVRFSRSAAMWAARPRRSVAGPVMTPTGTSTAKISRSRFDSASAASESPPRSVKCAAGLRSLAVPPRIAAAARVTVSSTGRCPASRRSATSSSCWAAARSA